MKKRIPTYNDCKNIVKTKGELVFYESTHNIDGYQISIFNYRLTNYDDFISPFNGEYIDWREIRGITFVFNLDGSLYRRFLLMRKFWNFNQVPETQYNILKDKKISRVTNKEDGSLITFIDLPNGKIIPKTKAGFDNDQIIIVNDIISKNNSLSPFVKYCLNLDIIPMFELISFRNRIVLNYSEEKLILIKLRNNSTGEYIELEKFIKNSNYNIESASVENFTNLDDMISLYEKLENKEGSVIEFEDGDMIKLKTAWYFNLHKLYSDYINQENIIIEYIVDNKIDEIISKLNIDTDKEKIEWINNIEKKIKIFSEKKLKDVNILLNEYHGDIKDFAIKYSKNKDFGLAISSIRGINLFDSIMLYIKKSTNKLEKARIFLNNIK